MNYVGVDYHKKYSYMVVKNEDGCVEGRGTVNNTKEEVQQFLEPYRPGMAVVEATRNWGLIYDWLDEVLDDVTLVLSPIVVPLVKSLPHLEGRPEPVIVTINLPRDI